MPFDSDGESERITTFGSTGGGRLSEMKNQHVTIFFDFLGILNIICKFRMILKSCSIFFSTTQRKL